MNNSDATKNKVITEKWRFLVATLGIIFHIITVGEKTLQLFHISVNYYAHFNVECFNLVSAQHIVAIQILHMT